MEGDRFQYRKTDLATGETKQWIGRPAASSNTTSKAPFVMVYQQACRDIALSEELTGFDLRVLWFLCGILDEENWIDVHHARIARQMDRPKQRSAVTRAIINLTNEGILLKGPERTYRLNPGYGWKGNKVAQNEAEKQMIKGHLSVVKP